MRNLELWIHHKPMLRTVMLWILRSISVDCFCSVGYAPFLFLLIATRSILELSLITFWPRSLLSLKKSRYRISRELLQSITTLLGWKIWKKELCMYQVDTLKAFAVIKWEVYDHCCACITQPFSVKICSQPWISLLPNSIVIPKQR